MALVIFIAAILGLQLPDCPGPYRLGQPDVGSRVHFPNAKSFLRHASQTFSGALTGLASGVNLTMNGGGAQTLAGGVNFGTGGDFK